MASDKHGFSIDQHILRDGTVSELSYGGVIRVLGSKPDLRALGTDYDVLEAVLPSNPTQPDKPARYRCSTKLCTMCTTPKCLIPPVSNLGGGTPGLQRIAVKRPAEIAAPADGGQPYLLAGDGDPRVSILILDGPADRALSAALKAHCTAVGIEQTLHFHVYQITLASSDLYALQDKLIAIPVIPGDVRPVVAVRSRRAA